MEEDPVEDTLPSDFFSLDAGDEGLWRDGEVGGLVQEQIRIEDQGGFERVILDLTRPTGNEDREEPFEIYVSATEDPSVGEGMEPTIMEGEFFIAISIPGLSPLAGDQLRLTDTLEGGLVEDVVQYGYEAGGGLALGLSSSQAEYRVSSTSDPYQLIVDVRPTAE